MSESGKAVFLSYASEDVEAALRICTALRAAGVEVWFDKDALIGGDAWDQKIRGQIGACALFMPVLSANTQARREGYFRLEWHLADDRMRLIAKGTPFIVPVTVDGTSERGALVPDSFIAVQWTKLPGGEMPAAFVDRVQTLLGGPNAPVAHAAPVSSRPSATSPAARSGLPLWVAAALGAVVLALVVFAIMRPGVKEAAPAKPIAESKPVSAVPPAPLVNDKSIAVLPFANLSPDKENEFFADGIHEDVLTNLQSIRELRVVSRTSVMGYRGTTKKIPEIARELGVTYILEGSVRRAQNKVRVSAQLIDARTDAHLWALPAGERDLTNIFAVQSEIAQAIGTALQAALTPKEKDRLAHSPTTNLAAYDLFLKAADVQRRDGGGVEGFTKTLPFLQSAVELDPKFAVAWGRLGRVHQELSARVPEDAVSHRDRAQRAIDTMERLAPDDPTLLLVLFDYYDKARDYPRADAYLQRAAQALPNSGEAIVRLGDVDLRHHRYPEALAHYRRAYERDRQSATARSVYVGSLDAIRRYDEAAAVGGENPRREFFKRGSTRELHEWFAAHPGATSANRLNWLRITGQAAEFVRQSEELRRTGTAGNLGVNHETNVAIALMAIGETSHARDLARKIISAADTRGTSNGRTYAINLALLGEKSAALDALEGWLADEAKDGFDVDQSSAGKTSKSMVLAWVGEKERAIAELARLLKLPTGVNVHQLRVDAAWKPLQGDPAFEALLNDPKNNAPLF